MPHLLAYLEAFHAVCTEGGFTAAAHRLGVSQPAISYQIRALERASGQKLLERGGRRVLLTPAGTRLRNVTARFFAELAELESDRSKRGASDPLQLCSVSGFGRYVLMPAVRALHQGWPEPRPELQLLFDAEEVVIDRLQRGECDAAFVYKRRVTNALRYRPVYREQIVLIGAPGSRRPASLRGFEGLSFVTYQECDYVFGHWFETRFGESPASVRSVAHFSELEEVVDFVRRGAGHSIVPRDCLPKKGVAILDRGAPCLNQVYEVTRAGSVARPGLEELVSRLKR